MKKKRVCNNCLKGTAISLNGDILCIEKGVVSADYVCSKHRFMPALKSIKGKSIPAWIVKTSLSSTPQILKTGLWVYVNFYSAKV